MISVPGLRPRAVKSAQSPDDEVWHPRAHTPMMGLFTLCWPVRRSGERKEGIMDPNETLRKLRKAVQDIDTDDRREMEIAAEEVIDYFQALDEWLTKGAYLPSDWA